MSSFISQEFKESVLRQIDNVEVCDDIKELKNDVIDYIESIIDIAKQKLQEMLPLTELLEAPTDPEKAIEWIKNFIDKILTLILSPVVKLQLDIAETAFDANQIIQSFNDKASEIKDCVLDLSPIGD